MESKLVSLSAALFAFIAAYGLRFVLSRLHGLLACLLFIGLSLLSGLGLCLFSSVWLSVRRSRGAKRRNEPTRLAFATAAAWERTQTRHDWASASAEKPIKQQLHPALDTEATSAIDEVLSLIMQHFVLAWYIPLFGQYAPRAFPAAVESIIRFCFAGIIKRAERLDWPTLLVSQILPKVTLHLQTFKQAGGIAVADSELDLALASKYAALLPNSAGGKSGLHEAVNVSSLNTKPSEEKWLRPRVVALLRLLMPKSESSSSAVFTMTREIVASAIVLPLVDMLSDPDFWNQQIDEKIAAFMQERQMVDQLLAALDNAPSSVPIPASAATAKRSISIKSITSEKDYEVYLKSIRRCTSLAEARRIRSDIVLALKRANLPIANQTSPTQTSTSVTAYLERLQSAKKLVDSRIKELGGDSIRDSVTTLPGQDITLIKILQNPTSLSHWLEHMDRRQRSSLIQFWLVVEGLKDAPLTDLSKTPQSGLTKDDVQFIWSSYFEHNPIIPLDQHIDQISSFLDNPSPSQTDLDRIRQTLLTLQDAALTEMAEDDFDTFRNGDLYIKALSSFSNAVESTSPPTTPRKGRGRKASLASAASVKSPLQRASSSTNSPTARRSNFPSLLPSFMSSSKPKFLSRSDLNNRMISPPTSPNVASDGLGFLFGADDEAARSPLFGTAQLLDDQGTNVTPRPETMDAIQEALSSILAGTGEEEVRPRRPAMRSASENSTTSLDGLSSYTSSAADLASLAPGLAKKMTMTSLDVHSSKARASTGVTSGLFEDNLTNSSLDVEDAEDASMSGSIDSLPAPSALTSPSTVSLPLKDAKIDLRLAKLRDQEGVIALLLRSATTKGTKREVKLLSKSLQAVQREIRALLLEKEQNSESAIDVIQPDNTSVSIPGTTISEANGNKFVLYLIEVRQNGADGSNASGWLATRRYSEFFALSTAMKERYPTLRQADFPSKRLVTSMSESFVQHRKEALEKYLQSMVANSQACSTPEMQTFLSTQTIYLPKMDATDAVASKRLVDLLPSQGTFRTLYKSVAIGFDELLAGPTLVEAVATRLSQQAAELAGLAPTNVTEEDMKGLSNSDVALGTSSEGLTYFTAPICDLLVELFELKARNNWLRRQAILVILQTVLGGTIERKMRDGVKVALENQNLVIYADTLKNVIFPNGAMRPQSVPRTAEQKEATRAAAHRRLGIMLPDLAANLIGRQNARKAARLIFAVLQNRRLTKHLIYSIAEDLLIEIFPELHRL